MVATPILGFLEEDKDGTFQPHDDALVVTIHIDGYDVKRDLENQGSKAEIMYPDLYKGLNLRPEDLEKYDGSQVMARQCLVTTITQHPVDHALVEEERIP